MLKIIPNTKDAGRIDVYVRACDMKPLQVGQVDDPHMPSYNGRFVLRSASDDCDGEIIDLTRASVNACWQASAAFRVRLLRPDEPLIIELRNE